MNKSVSVAHVPHHNNEIHGLKSYKEYEHASHPNSGGKNVVTGMHEKESMSSETAQSSTLVRLREPAQEVTEAKTDKDHHVSSEDKLQDLTLPKPSVEVKAFLKPNAKCFENPCSRFGSNMKYHKSLSCKYIQEETSPRCVIESEAKEFGHTPCSLCFVLDNDNDNANDNYIDSLTRVLDLTKNEAEVEVYYDKRLLASKPRILKNSLEKAQKGRKKWSIGEEKALMKGVQKHGKKWANILGDDEFAATLSSRTNVDLKDKYRNLGKKNA